MLGAGNIRQILRDTLAILVWHAVFSSLWNTFKALKDMPAWIPGFFSQVMQPQVTIFIPLTSVLLVCLGNMLHLSEECWLLTGQVQQHLLYSVALSPSSRLPRFSICCPRSSEYSKCEGVNVWGKACMCLFAHVLWAYVDVLARSRAEATGLLSGLLSCNGDRDAVFIYLSPSCHCCVWSVFAELRAMGHLENCQIHSQLCRMLQPRTHPGFLLWKTKAERDIQDMCNLLSDSPPLYVCAQKKSEQQYLWFFWYFFVFKWHWMK